MQDQKTQFHRLQTLGIAVNALTMVSKVMEKFPEKVLRLLEAADIPQAKAARAIDVDTSQFARWLKGKGGPTAVQLLGLARFFGVPMEYLADDSMDEPSGVDQLTDLERELIKEFRYSGMSQGEAIRRLTMPLKTTHDPKR